MAETGGPLPAPFTSKPTSSFERAGDRVRLTVDLRPGETTIVSWKKLVREATRKPSASGPSASRPNPEFKQLPISQPQSSPPSVLGSKQLAENEPNSSDAQPGSNRLASVIEKIERLYAGNGSSDEEDVVLDDVPDDDEYDTEDSFIDDAELDDYFKIDKSTIKHDGFFVNRGKLERIEPTVAMDQQPKKRRRKDGTRGQGGDDGPNPNKQIKTGNKSRKASFLIKGNATSQLPSTAVSNVHNSDQLLEASPVNASVSRKKKNADAQIASVSSGLPSDDGIRQDTGDDHQRNQVLSLQNHKSEEKDSYELCDSSAKKLNERSSHGSKSHAGKQQNNADEQEQGAQYKQKVGLPERFDLNVPATRESSQVMKVAPALMRKDGSNVRSRVTLLEKAIRELEKIVAESRPPSTEVQDNDNSSQGIKRRLPADIKQKLAKVARLAVLDNFGKVPKDVINRLMSIVGHMMQLRTLKRNLKIMATLGMNAKKEKDDRLQKIKQEVAEMVRLKIPYVESKVEQQATNSDDFQETGSQEKEALKRKCSMDDALENKICDLYDLYVERLEEHSGPPVKRLYEELAALWPSGVMHTDGIKRAIYKAKNRRKVLSARRKDQDKIKKALGSKAEDSVRGEAINVHPSLHTNEKLSEASDGASPFTSNPVRSASTPPTAAARLSAPFASDPITNKQKQEKSSKGSSSGNPAGPVPTDTLPKKKVKRKPNIDAGEAEWSRLEKPAEEKQKHHKDVVVSLPVTNLEPNAAAPSEKPS